MKIKSARERRYTATFIDQGYCFHDGDWKFIDVSLGGVFAENTVYRSVTGWSSFEPWLSRMENMEPETVWSIAKTIPPEWHDGDLSALELLLQRLLARRTRLRDLILAFRESSPPVPQLECRSRRCTTRALSSRTPDA